MNVLCHGIPFCCDETPLERYRGPHDVRLFGNYEKARYRYNPLEETFPEVIARIRREWSPDLVLCWVPEIHPPPMKVEDSPIPTVALVSDWNVYYPVLQNNLARYDAVLCDMAGTRALAGDLVSPQYLFPLYSQISTLHYPRQVPKDIDVLFVGNLNHAAHSARARYLERLAALSDRWRVVIAGGVFEDAYAELLSRARIVFNHSIRGEVNLRVLETMACGALAFLESENLEGHGLFENGRDIVFYDSENLEERLRHYLENPTEAQAIAARGRALAESLAGEKRFDRLIEWAAAQPKGKRAFLDLPEPEREYQTLLMYGFSRWRVYYPIQERLVVSLADTLPNDPRVWTAVGRHLLAPREDRIGRERCMKSFLVARRLAPHAAPYVLNAASVARMYGFENLEMDCLKAVLEAHTLDGAELLVGNQQDAFYVRWCRSVAEKIASVAMLKAEANIRLGQIHARKGNLLQAEHHLGRAADQDPQNVGGVSLRAEVLWADGQRAAAVELMQAHLQDHPFDFNYRSRLYDMYFEEGCTAEAELLARSTKAIRQACSHVIPQSVDAPR